MYWLLHSFFILFFLFSDGIKGPAGVYCNHAVPCLKRNVYLSSRGTVTSAIKICCLTGELMLKRTKSSLTVFYIFCFVFLSIHFLYFATFAAPAAKVGSQVVDVT